MCFHHSTTNFSQNKLNESPSSSIYVLYVSLLGFPMTVITAVDQILALIFMMTSSNGNIFRVAGPLCGEFTGSGEFPTQRPVTRSFDVFFDLRLNKRLSKRPWGWWFVTPSWSLWRQCYELTRSCRIKYHFRGERSHNHQNNKMTKATLN